MNTKKQWAACSEVTVHRVGLTESGGWVVSGTLAPKGICPECGMYSRRRHGGRHRRLQYFPAHGEAVWVELRVCRWRCASSGCRCGTFSDRTSLVAIFYSRRTSRLAQIASHLGHVTGGRAAERRMVVDILEDRNVESCTEWLRRHPDIAIISRDRCGLHTQAARQGAPQALQVTDRFHLVQSLRMAIEEQMNMHGRATGRAHLSDADNISTDFHLQRSRLAHRKSREEIFTTIHALRENGLSCSEIERQTGFRRSSVARWLAFKTPPDRRRAALTPTSPWYFEEVLAQCWKDGNRRGRQLFHEVQ